MMENIKPMDIEKRSFAIITELLGDTKLEEENELVIKRVSTRPRILTMCRILCSPRTP